MNLLAELEDAIDIFSMGVNPDPVSGKYPLSATEASDSLSKLEMAINHLSKVTFEDLSSSFLKFEKISVHGKVIDLEVKIVSRIVLDGVTYLRTADGLTFAVDKNYAGLYGILKSIIEEN